MANRQIFNSLQSRVRKADTINRAGGTAYKFDDEHALCQYVVTGTFNGTYYATAQEQLDEVKKLVGKIRPDFVAKAAIYGRQKGRMKDVPAYLMAHLAAKGELELLRAAWPLVINNPKMLLNFVQIVRSGVTGRKSFGSAVRRLIREWITSRSGNKLYRASIGYTDPSLTDVVKMVHPTPVNTEQSALFAYLLGATLDENDILTRYSRDGEVLQQYELAELPKLVQDVEWFKHDNANPLPDLDFRALTNYGLTEVHWKKIAGNMPWNTLRMNLNTLARNGVFQDKGVTAEVVAKLSDPEEVRKWNAFPYQLLTTYQNVGDDIPQSVKNALQIAMETATENVPYLGKEIAVCIDLSASMGSPVTSDRNYGVRLVRGASQHGTTTRTTCVDVAALIAAALARANPDDTKVIAWASSCAELKNFNPFDSIMTNSQRFAHCGIGGGTNSELALRLLNRQKWAGDLVIYVSDNQSWMHSNRYGGTGMENEWQKFKARRKGAKLVCIDIQAYGDTQVKDATSVLNIGGFNDSVFEVIQRFVETDSNTHFVDVVDEVEIGA